MKITCPDCGFFRELVADRAPVRPVIATCPKCGCRFRFQPEDGACLFLEHGQTPPAAPAPAPAQEDDPLPPGAIVPGRTDSGWQSPQLTKPDSPRAAAPERERTEDALDARQETAATPGEDEPRPANRKRRSRPAPDEEINPWDMAPHPAGYLSAFYQTSLRVMFGAGRFFAHLNPEAPQLRALAYALLISLVVLGSMFFWLNMSREVLEQAAATNTPFMQVIRLALDHPLLYALISLASMVFQIYFAAALLFLGFRLSGARQASFYIIFQVVAYSSAPMLLCIIPLIGSQVGFIWAIACLVNGCRVALQLDWPRTLLGFAPLVLLCALFALGMPLP